MDGRDYQRIPCNMQVQFRTPSSFLLSYVVNLSRGGIFLESEQLFSLGSELQLHFTVPGAGPISVQGKVAWCRGKEEGGGPSGVGVEFQDVGDVLGRVIDRLVAEFTGVKILVLSADEQDRTMLSRLIHNIMSSVEIVSTSDAVKADELLSQSTMDLLVVDINTDSEWALAMIVKAKSESLGVPVLALASSLEMQEQARQAGADKVVPNPPPSTEFQQLLIGTMGKPLYVREAD